MRNGPSATGPTLVDTVGRRPRDVVTIAAAAALVAGLAFAAAATGVTATEVHLFQLFHDLPERFGIVLLPVLFLGSAIAVAVAAGVALYLQRVRLGIALAAAGGAAWAATWLIERLVQRPVAADVLQELAVRGPGHAAPFPSSEVAVVVALTVVVAPYVSSAVRTTGWWLAGAVAVAVLFAGTALPLGVVVGALVGWWAGSTVTTLTGAPGRRVGPEIVRDALATAGIAVDEVRLVAGRPWDEGTFLVTSADGPDLTVRTGRAASRAHGLVTRFRRYLASLETFDGSGLTTARHAVEHEAYVTLIAERAGVRVPPLALARELPGGAALIAHRRIDGVPLQDLGDGLTDELLRRVWDEVVGLHAAGVAHRALWPDAILVDRAGATYLTSFGDARAAARPDQQAQDVAELLAGLALLTDPDRASRSAVEVLGPSPVEAALAFLQPLAMPRRVRLALRHHAELLPAVRNAAAEAVGVDPPETQLRIRASTVLGLLLAGGAIYTLLPQIGSFERLVGALEGANWGWLLVTFAAWTLTPLAGAVAIRGASPLGLPLLRTAAVQLAGTFAGRLTPAGLGGMGLNLLYLEHEGSTRPQAVSTVALNAAAGFVVHAVLFGVAAAILGLGTVRGRLEVPSGWPALAAIVVVLTVAGVALGTPLGRRRVARPVADAVRTLAATLRHPGRAAALFGGATAITIANATGFAAAVHAFGGSPVSTLSLFAVYVGGSAVGQAAPTPGGLGTVEAALVAAAVAVGVPSERAVAATLTFRLLTFWLPILPGLVAYRVLQSRGQFQPQESRTPTSVGRR